MNNRDQLKTEDNIREYFESTGTPLPPYLNDFLRDEMSTIMRERDAGMRHRESNREYQRT